MGMITLNGGWAIDADGIQYVLGRPTSSIVRGKTVQLMQSASYHSTVEQALTSFLRRVQREQIKSHDFNLEQACKALLDAKSEVLELTGDSEIIKSK